ncbi:MAG: hypothetical protein K2P53_05865, partial [Rickettsiales bacterium]|nr:hypothetical protein [Rickettsiales bacterium]
NYRIKKFFNDVFEHGAFPLINKPTRITETSATSLDNIITTDIFNKSLKKGIIKCDITDHFPIFFSTSISPVKISQQNLKFKKRFYTTENLKSFNEQLSLLHWKQLEVSTDANLVYNTFFKTFYELYNANFPISTVKKTTKGLMSPWITKDLRKSSKIKQKLYIKYLKTKSEENKTLYKNYAKNFEKKRKILKKSYYSNLLEANKNNSKRTWEIIREITGALKTKTCSLPKTLKINNDLSSNSTMICDELNKYFVSVGPNLAKKIPFVTNNIDVYNFPILSSLTTYELSIEDFEKSFKMLKSNKSIGHDGINGNVVINSYETLKDVLFKVFSCLIKQGIFPDHLKIAKVTPIFKVGDPTNVTNYRPISVLSAFSKVFERILYNVINNHLSLNNILYVNQYGFKKNNSTEHAILQITRSIAESFDKSQYTLGVFIDLSKNY